MTYYFAKSTNGFYVDDVHEPHQIPDDAVEITDEQHQELLQGQSNGKQITSDDTGNPILVDPIKVPVKPLTAEQKLAKLGLTPEDLKALLG
jgi:hypothetical protein